MAKHKQEMPSKETLDALRLAMPRTQIAKKYNVPLSTVKRWIKRRGSNYVPPCARVVPVREPGLRPRASEPQFNFDPCKAHGWSGVFECSSIASNLITAPAFLDIYDVSEVEAFCEEFSHLLVEF